MSSSEEKKGIDNNGLNETCLSSLLTSDLEKVAPYEFQDTYKFNELFSDEY